MGRFLGKKADTMQDELARLNKNVPHESFKPGKEFHRTNAPINNVFSPDHSDQYSGREKVRYLLMLGGGLIVIAIVFMLFVKFTDAFLNLFMFFLYGGLFILGIFSRTIERKFSEKSGNRPEETTSSADQGKHPLNSIPSYQVDYYGDESTEEEKATDRKINEKVDEAMKLVEKLSRK